MRPHRSSASSSDGVERAYSLNLSSLRVIERSQEGLVTLLDQAMHGFLADAGFVLRLYAVEPNVAEAVHLADEKIFPELTLAVVVGDDLKTKSTNERNHKALNEVVFEKLFVSCPHCGESVVEHGLAVRPRVVRRPSNVIGQMFEKMLSR